MKWINKLADAGPMKWRESIISPAIGSLLLKLSCFEKTKITLKQVL